MKTYQDLAAVYQAGGSLTEFIEAAILEHKGSALYRTAMVAQDYDRCRNRTILNYEKTLRTFSGKEVPDLWSPNHKTTRNFFRYFTTQQTQFLLGNGVTWDDDTGEKLGEDFDTRLQEIGRDALVDAVAFGFWNFDHLCVFRLTEFVPLQDEENGALRAGIRFWQISPQKPLRVTLYEEDGYTEYIKGRNKRSDWEVLQEKRSYKQIVRTSAIDGTEILDWENYPSFPIVPLWANRARQSELVGIQEQIDAYDLIKNGYLNDLDTAQVYWIIKNAGGMDDVDLARFLEHLHMTKIASADDADVQAHTVNIPFEAREKLLDRIERDLFRDYMALDTRNIASGAVTATQILAAYEPMSIKADMFEYFIRDFLDGILAVAGLHGHPAFTRSKMVNVSEEVTTVIQAATALDQEYVTRKILTLLGDADMIDTVLERIDADEYGRMEVGDGSGTQEDGRAPEETGEADNP